MATLRQLEREQVGVCVSGGLSSLAAAAWLADRGLDVRLLVADVGQVDHEAPAALADRLSAAGLPTEVVDLRADMAALCLDLVTAQARYEGGYWNTTGASRAVLARGLGPALAERGCTVLAHGSVAGGNDHARFERYTRQWAPGLEPVGVWALPESAAALPDRAAMVAFLERRGLHAGTVDAARISTDGNLGGVSHEGTALEDLRTPSTVVEPYLTVWPRQGPDEPETFRVRFAGGRPVAVGEVEVAVDALACLDAANTAGGRHGLGLRTVVENRMNGTKCRGVYEAPGLDLLGSCAELLYQVTVDKEAYRLHQQLSVAIGRWTYEGALGEPAAAAAHAAVGEIVAVADGTVEVELYKGTVAYRAVDSTSRTSVARRQTRFSRGGQQWVVSATSLAGAEH